MDMMPLRAQFLADLRPHAVRLDDGQTGVAELLLHQRRLSLFAGLVVGTLTTKNSSAVLPPAAASSFWNWMLAPVTPFSSRKARSSSVDGAAPGVSLERDGRAAGEVDAEVALALAGEQAPAPDDHGQRHARRDVPLAQEVDLGVLEQATAS